MSGSSIFIIIGLGVFFMGLLILPLYLRHKYMKMAQDKLLCTFWMHSGARLDVLLPKVGGKFIPAPAGHKTKEGMPFTGNYIFEADRTANALYPPYGVPTFVRVTLPSIIYAEGNPEPNDPFDRPPLLTEKTLALIADDATAKAFMGQAKDALAGGASKLGLKRAHLYILGGILLAGFGIIGILVFLLSGKIDYMLRAFGL